MMKSIQIFLLVLIVIGISLLLTQNVWVPKLVTYILESSAESNTQNSVPTEKSDTTVMETYSNKTIGLSFQYPTDWQFTEDFVDPVTRGDMVKEDTSFSVSLLSPDWGKDSGESTSIIISHSPLRSSEGESYDNLPVSDQLKAIACIPNEVNVVECKEGSNKNGVKYLRKIVCAGDYGCAINTWVPTGKYIISFGLPLETLDSGPQSKYTVDEIINSIQLQ